MRFARLAGLATACVVLGQSVVAFAQAIAGVVRDASGGVMPGVTVEAASPVLIEKTRTIVNRAACRLGRSRFPISDWPMNVNSTRDKKAVCAVSAHTSQSTRNGSPICVSSVADPNPA